MGDSDAPIPGRESMDGMFADPESHVARDHWAVVQTTRRSRKRFPDSCVRLMADEAEALAGADPAQGEYPARVYGPSRSSEGVRLYYLIRWLS